MRTERRVLPLIFKAKTRSSNQKYRSTFSAFCKIGFWSWSLCHVEYFAAYFFEGHKAGFRRLFTCISLWVRNPMWYVLFSEFSGTLPCSHLDLFSLFSSTGAGAQIDKWKIEEEGFEERRGITWGKWGTMLGEGWSESAWHTSSWKPQQDFPSAAYETLKSKIQTESVSL